MEENLRFKIDWASLTVGRKFTVLALFYFVCEGNFPSTSSQGGYIWRGDLTEGFFALPVRGAYTWRGLFFGILWYVPTAESSLCHLHSMFHSNHGLR